MEVKKRVKAYIRRIWKQKKIQYEKMMRAVICNINNLEKLKKLEKKKR